MKKRKMAKIIITFPDGNKKEFKKGITGYDIAYAISPSLAKESIAVELNSELRDINYQIINDSIIKIIKIKDEESLELIRHDCAHVMAEAVQELFPGTQVTIGPAIKDGFYYDFYREKPFTDDDLIIIEKKMHHIIKRNDKFIREVWDRDKAIKYFSSIKEIYKTKIINDLPPNEEITIYKQGKWMDLCRGPHLPSTKFIGKAFKLMKVSGAYWKGDSSNEMLSRIYGTAWRNTEELAQYLEQIKEAEKRDHRKLGKELKLFTFDEEVGPGLPLWLPNGTVIVDELEKLAKETEDSLGYLRVRTPHITKEILYEKSGHLNHFKESMFPAMDIDGNKYYIKPMNCPHHHKIFASSPRSYKELPLRLSEYGTCYRYEKSGQLFGLMRVRSMQMNDAHIYCSEKQFKDEFLSVCNLYLKYFEIFGIEKYEMRLSLHNPKELGEKYINEPELWLKTEKLVKEVLSEGKLNYVEISGEAAFYGPKIDVQVWSSIGKEFTLATNQVDFAIPSKFGLVYKDENDCNTTPLCIHRAPLGTHERFIGFLIEHFGGDFPLWLSPNQIVIIPVSEKNNEYAENIYKKLRANNIRTLLDLRDEKVGAKIRKAELSKIPIMLIIGEKEELNKNISIRRRKKGDLGSMRLKDFISDISREIINKELSY